MAKQDLHFSITATNDDLKRKLAESRQAILDSGKTAEATASRIDGSFKRMAASAAALGGGIAIGAMAKELYSFANAFDKSMREVSTISETVSADMDGFKQSVLGMTKQIPVAANDAAKALYQIISAGHDGAKGMQVLEVSAKAAIGGVTQTATAADAITTMLNAYKKDSAEAESISDQLFTTVRLGKTTFGELGQSIAQAVPIAASFGIETEQVLAAVATLTKSGTPTAQAMTQIRASIIGASKALGDGYFQTHTFQEGLAEIARRAGGSEAELGNLIPEIEGMNGVLGLTGLNAQMAASDLAELGNSAGSTEKAFAKMNAGTEAQVTLLKNSLLAKFHSIGEGALDVVGDIASFLNSDGIFNTTVLDDLIATMGVLIATVGVYKAQLLITNAVKLVGNNLVIAEEIKAYQALLPVKEASKNKDIEAMVAKGQLSQKRAIELIAIRAEVQAELEKLKIKAQVLAAEAAAAAQAHKNALQRSLAAKQNMALAQSSMKIAIQSGNAEEIAAAKTATRTAKLEVNSSAIAVNTTRQALGTAQSQANSAATAVGTMQTNINTVATRSATTAKNLWTAATMRLTKAFHSMKVAFASNPIGLLLTGVTLAITAFSMFGNKVEEVSGHTDLLNKSIADLGIETAKEVQQIDNAFAKLLKAKKGTQEYGEAKDAIISKYGEYLRGLSAEISSLNDVELAYNAVRNAAEDSIKVRFKASFIEQANEDATKKMGEAIKNIITNVKGGFGDDFLKRYPDQIAAINAEIVNALTNTERTLRGKQIDIGAILEDYGISTVNATKIMSSMDFFDFGERENFVATFEEAFQSALNIGNIANNAFDSITESQTKNGEKLETVLERRKRLTKELQDATSLLERMQSDSSTASETEIESQKTKIKNLEQSLNIDHKTATKDYSSEVEDMMLKLEQSKIEILQEGRAKELAQIEITRKEKLAALEKERKGIEEKQKAPLTEAQTERYDTFKANINTGSDQEKTKVNKKYDDEIEEDWKALTAVFLSEEQKRGVAIDDRYNKERERLDERLEAGTIDKDTHAKFSIQIDASQAKEQLDALTADYQTYADQRKAIETKFDADIAALQAKNKDGKLDGNIDEAEKQKKEALSKVKIEEVSQGIDFTQLFGNLDNLTLPSMKSLRDKIKAWIDEAGNSLSPEDLKAVSDAFLKLELKLADKDPFAILKSSAKELKTASKEAEEAQKTLNAAIAKSGKDSDVAKNAAEAYNAALEKRAAAVTRAKEAIGSVADKGQQIVGAAQDVLSILDDLGVQVPENISNAIGGIGQVMDGLGSIDLTNPLSIVTGAVKMIGGLVKTVTSLFNGDGKREDEIQRLQSKIDALSTSYDRLQKEAEKAYSTDASKLIDQSNELIEKQKTLIKLQIAGEEAKKDTDNGKIEEWKKQIDELDQKASENIEKKIDVVLGSDWKSDVDSLVSGYMDSFGVVGQGAEDMAKQIKKNIIAGLLSKDIDAAVEQGRKKIAALAEDGELSEADMAEIDAYAEDLTKIMDQRGKMYEKLLKDEKNAANENSKVGMLTSAGLTEQTAGEFIGIQRGQSDKLASIDRKFDLGFSHIAQIAKINAAIEANTRATAVNTAATVEVLAIGFSAMQGELVAINQNTSKDAGSYGN